MNTKVTNGPAISFCRIRGGRLLARIAVLVGSIAAAFATFPACADQASAETANQLTEILVTAEKRSENIQSAPSAITAVSGDELTAAGAVDIREMSDLFPSSRFEEIWAWAHLYVRGIGAEQDRISVDQLVNMFVDGVVLPRELNSVSMSDVAAIELLPGPQGTLYGASSVGGVLNIRNNRPVHDDETHLMVEAGNYSSLHFRAVENFDVNEQLALRASVDHIGHSPYESDIRWSANTTTAKLAALYTPSDFFSAYVWALYYYDDSQSMEAQVKDAKGNWIPGNNDAWNVVNNCSTIACNGSGNAPAPGNNNQTSYSNIISGEFNWHFTGFTVTDIISGLNVNMASPATPNWIFGGFVYQAGEHQITNELKVASDAGTPVQWLAGLYLYQIHADTLITFAGFQMPQFTQQNVAPYAQMIFSITDNFRATVGARYSDVKKDGTFLQPAVLAETSATWSGVDWKAGVEYDVAPGTMLYATAQTGSSPGTLDPSVVVNGDHSNATKLTKLDSLTVGWKSELFGNRLVFDNELFYYDYKDFLIQTVVCGASATCFPLNTVYLNAPKMISMGDQLDVHWLITPHDSVNVSYAYTSAKTGNWITNAGANLSHQTLLEAPLNTVSLGAQHSFDMQSGGHMVMRADSYLSSGYYGDFQTQPGVPVHYDSVHQTSYTKTNAALTYHAPGDRWTLGLWARNLEDKAQIGPASAFGPGSFTRVASIQLLAAAPRTYGLSFTLNVPTGLR
jgi:iron complex outermembrane receptor protein